MSLLRETAPTREEFIEAVKADFLRSFPQYTEEQFNEMLNSNDGQDFINDGYNSNLAEFEGKMPHHPKITRKQFLEAGASAVVYNFYMWF